MRAQDDTIRHLHNYISGSHPRLDWPGGAGFGDPKDVILEHAHHVRAWLQSTSSLSWVDGVGGSTGLFKQCLEIAFQRLSGSPFANSAVILS